MENKENDDIVPPEKKRFTRGLINSIIYLWCYIVFILIKSRNILEKKMLFMMVLISILGVSGFFFTSDTVNAASFETMKEYVEKDEGLIYNPELGGVMAKEDSIEFVDFIETEKENLNTDEVTPTMYEKAYKSLKSAEIVEGTKDLDSSIIQQRGVKAPTKVAYPPHNSNAFSGAGWRYSNIRFAFSNYNKDYLFGVRAYKDTFYFTTYTNGNYYYVAQHVVPVSLQYVFYPATDRGRNLNGYFSTYNPVVGSRYYII